QQLSFDPHEWDYDSWSWTGQQPQRMKWGDPSPHHPNLAAVTYNSWVFTGPANGGDAPIGFMGQMRARAKNTPEPFPATRDAVKRVYWSALDYTRKLGKAVTGTRQGERPPDDLRRDADVYRDHAVVRAQDHCHYQYAPQCEQCDVKAICDGFHGDYA